nr:metallophosphoesterase [Corallococcus soli]
MNWLHLSDLHLGTQGSRLLRPEYRQAFELDLRNLHEQTGPWDVVFISGDLTLTGSLQEFQLLDATLRSLWDYLRSLGSDPVLFAVPGDHDAWNSASFNLSMWMLEDNAWSSMHGAFKVSNEGQLARDASKAFAPFTDWFGSWRHEHLSHRLESFKKGLLPGDFVATLVKNKLRIGVVGLNSIFTPPVPGRTSPPDSTSTNPKGLLRAVHTEQIEAALGKNIADWTREHDAVLLVTHDSPRGLYSPWLHAVQEVLTPHDRTLLHLCSGWKSARGFFLLRRDRALATSVHAPSLFSRVDTGKEQQWGYVAGQLDLQDRPALRLFPHSVVRRKGALKFGVVTREDIGIDGSIVVPWTELVRVTARTPLPMDASAEQSRLTAALMRPLGPSVKGPGISAVEEKLLGPLPRGVKLRKTLSTKLEHIGWMAWSPMGDALAVGMRGGRLAYWTPSQDEPLWEGLAHDSEIVDLGFSPDGRLLASRSRDRVCVWSTHGERLRDHEPPGDAGNVVAWSPEGLLVVDSLPQRTAHFWNAGKAVVPMLPDEVSRLGPETIYAMAWSGNGQHLAYAGSGTKNTTVLFLRAPGVRVLAWRSSTRLWSEDILDVAWKPAAQIVAMAGSAGSIYVEHAEDDVSIKVLEGHTDAVTGVSFSHDGRLLASQSHDGTIRLWRTDSWEFVAQIKEPQSYLSNAGLAFSPVAPVLASPGHGGRSVRLWDFDIDALLQSKTAPATVHELSAKVVLVGEGGVGKSCLAMRMVMDQYEELGPTHGMKFWTMHGEPAPATPGGVQARREIVLWDLGGQSEYQLVHQLFIRDSTVALMVMQPRQGERGLEDIEFWNTRLMARSSEKPIRKILVGTQVDDAQSPVDHPALENLVQRLGFERYVLTSAKTGLGVRDLTTSLNAVIPWDAIEPVSRPELFQRLRLRIQSMREAGRVVLPFLELEAELKRDFGQEFDPKALHIVVAHMNRQGIAADSRMADGRRVLILEVEQLERYAGSLVVAARENTHGVPAIDLARVMSPAMEFPRIRREDRLPRDQELPVLDCVTELLIENGICLRHEGLLVFPSLFQQLPSEDPDVAFPHAVSLYYDFTGPIDNIYASLVAELAISRRFGALRLWNNRAEFGGTGEERSGIRRGPSSRGGAKLDVYFGEATEPFTRALFINFIETHLRERGVALRERLSVTCACGRIFPEDAVQERLRGDKSDIPCSYCDTRTVLTLGAEQSREKNPEVVSQLHALRIEIEETRAQIVTEVKVSMDKEKKVQPTQGTPLRILHLSDLHVEATDNPDRLLQPLVGDLTDREEGLGIERLDYLVISGDITQRATPQEFEQARHFVSRLIQQFSLTAQRCIIVPGNHDLDWNTRVYEWRQGRLVDTKRLPPGSFVPEGSGFLVRDDAKYSERFTNFSEHFFHPLMQKPYPLAAGEQCLPSFFKESRIQFLAMNSASTIDEFFRSRAGIDDQALSRGLLAADGELAQARHRGDLREGERVLRMAVWHHPISGNEKMVEDAFVSRLHQSEVKVCLHGHVHEDRADLLNYLHPCRRLHVIGAGSFGAHAHERPASTPNLYNLIEVQRDLGRLTVHTRSRSQIGGAWTGWAKWPGATPRDKRTYYDVTLP